MQTEVVDQDNDLADDDLLSSVAPTVAASGLVDQGRRSAASADGGCRFRDGRGYHRCRGGRCEHGLGGNRRPYVCRTNIVKATTAGGTIEAIPHATSPPILIWRHRQRARRRPCQMRSIATQGGQEPPPAEFVLYGAGDRTTTLVSGPYRHIIFNQSLQEGWDDPSTSPTSTRRSARQLRQSRSSGACCASPPKALPGDR